LVVVSVVIFSVYVMAVEKFCHLKSQRISEQDDGGSVPCLGDNSIWGNDLSPVDLGAPAEEGTN
jgi:hypothetical protein